LEEEYHIVISSEQATFDTLAEAVNIVDSLIQARQG
jgi:hypothetical protein